MSFLRSGEWVRRQALPLDKPLGAYPSFLPSWHPLVGPFRVQLPWKYEFFITSKLICSSLLGRLCLVDFRRSHFLGPSSRNEKGKKRVPAKHNHMHVWYTLPSWESTSGGRGNSGLRSIASFQFLPTFLRCVLSVYPINALTVTLHMWKLWERTHQYVFEVHLLIESVATKPVKGNRGGGQGT